MESAKEQRLIEGDGDPNLQAALTAVPGLSQLRPKTGRHGRPTRTSNTPASAQTRVAW